jgi:MOSC domain-containing protein YiiM
MSAIEIGQYRYTETDARRTLMNLAPWWELLAVGRDATSLWPIASRLAASMSAQLGIDTDPAVDLDQLSQLSMKADLAQLPMLLATMLTAIDQAGDTLRQHGQMPTTRRGSVHQLSSSKGGVPKLPIDSIEVDFGGFVGDKQETRLHHGRPWQALCLWSNEVVDTFAGAGHPIFVGAAGENISTVGIDWTVVGPGVRLRIGSVLCEASMWALPCKKNADWFIGGDFSVMHHDRGPISRMYATVLEPGRIAAGDEVILEP